MNKTPGQPRLDPEFVRIKKCYRLHPATAKKIERLAKERNLSQGQMVDKLAGIDPRGES